MGAGVVDVLAGKEQSGVGGGRVEGEDDGARLHERHEFLGHLAEDHVEHGEDDDVGLGRGGGGLGQFAAQVADQLLARGRRLAEEHPEVAVDQVVGDTLAHLAGGPDDGDGLHVGAGLDLGGHYLLLRRVLMLCCVHWCSSRAVAS